MQFIDLKTQHARLREEIGRRIHAVLEHGKYIMGPEIMELETRLAEYVGVKHCIGCSSGTDALLMPLLAWGIGPGDAVFTTPFTFIATAEVIALLGATPVFVDIDPETFNLDPEKLDRAIEAVKAGKKPSEGAPVGLTPKAIIPVDLFGLPADYDAIGSIAGTHGLKVLEDACQGFGGVYKGKKACSFGDAAATSFFPAKPLGCYGDGGAVFTNNDDLIEIMKSIRVHGQGTDKYTNVRVGINGRLDTIQAAILLSKLNIFEEEVQKRREVASRYNDLLGEKVKTPVVPDGYRSAWAQYSVLTDQRDRIMETLKEHGIPSAVYYPIPLHLQDAFAGLGYKKGDMPVSEEMAEKIFSLPMHPYLEAVDQRRIADLIVSVL